MSCGSSNDDMGFLRRQEGLESQRLEETWKRVLTRCFQRIDEMAFDTCYECGIGTACGCPSYTLGMGGSTALLVILTEETIIVANCGNSRAVLSRGGEVISLSIDHKPDRPDERARIEACGGQVLFGGCARVQGILAISRAIGDKYLKKYITSEPEFTFIKRQWEEDELLIIASDGLWDVLSNEMACRVAREFLHGDNLAGNHSSRPSTSTTAVPPYPSASASASLLVQLAMEQNSPDNISVIVVDLKTNSTRL
ncbi:hypothetical protein HAX54_029076 [Datura stramonium]|uniref:PPM-type phosphatase domain-containing protein n=1 Tax=Datura stramonium TaxID=4076 RepID=A0ABS8V7L9_DATST|nr:hypothetical protein [Datura stramonium]